MTSLTEQTLAQLNVGVSVPRYDCRRVTTGIVHASSKPTGRHRLTR